MGPGARVRSAQRPSRPEDAPLHSAPSSRRRGISIAQALQVHFTPRFQTDGSKGRYRANWSAWQCETCMFEAPNGRIQVHRCSRRLESGRRERTLRRLACRRNFGVRGSTILNPDRECRATTRIPAIPANAPIHHYTTRFHGNSDGPNVQSWRFCGRFRDQRELLPESVIP